MNDATREGGEAAAFTMDEIRAVQRRWSERPTRERTQVVRRARHLLAERSAALASASATLRSRPAVEALTAEVIPLLDAHLFMERVAPRLLRPRRLGARWRPLWMANVETEIRREPFGVVLIIGPANYPLLLPGVQILQALTAGNAVLFKPAPGTTSVAFELRRAWLEAGLPAELFRILSEAPSAVESALRCGVEKLVLTGSHETGQAVARACAEAGIPAVLELSGCDLMVIREDAELSLASRAIAFGAQWNGGATCIAPRRLFVHRRIAERLEAELQGVFESAPNYEAPPALAERLQPLFEDAMQAGAAVLAGGPSQGGGFALPLLLSDGRVSMPLLQQAIFAPVLGLVLYDCDEEIPALAAECPYALGASIFSRDIPSARRLAERLEAGVVTINDVIVPTADPRLPFAGRRRSGYGVTRGVEGLLEMTTPKAITVSGGKWRPHFEPTGAAEEAILHAYIETAHSSSWRARFAALGRLVRAGRNLQSKSPL